MVIPILLSNPILTRTNLCVIFSANAPIEVKEVIDVILAIQLREQYGEYSGHPLEWEF